MPEAKAARLVIHLVGLGAAFISSGCRAKQPTPQTTVLRIETTKRQTIKGWGIYPCTIRNDRPNADLYTLWKRPNAQRLIFKDLGASLIRSEIPPGSYDAKRDDGSLDEKYLDASLVRQLRIAQRFGHRRYFLSVWSPPALFKSPATTLGQDPKTRREAHLRPDRETAYCRYVVRVFDYLTKRKGLAAPIAFSLQNEPNFGAPLWDGTPYGAAQWQRVALRMRRALDAGGYEKVALIGPEAGSYKSSLDLLGGVGAPALQKEPLRSALCGLAFHGYTLESHRAPYPQQMRDVALKAQNSGKEIWMSEWSIMAAKRTSLDHALEVTQRLGREMTYVPCNYWCWWQGWDWHHPKSEVLLTGSDDSKLHISKTYYVLQKLWHSAPAGSVVQQVQSNDPEISGFHANKVQTVAFATKKGQTLLLVNPNSGTKTVNLQGLTGRKATRFMTDAARDMAAQPALSIANGEVSFSMPGRAIMILETRQ
jgi:O-glycosyl hydrolase